MENNNQQSQENDGDGNNGTNYIREPMIEGNETFFDNFDSLPDDVKEYLACLRNVLSTKTIYKTNTIEYLQRTVLGGLNVEIIKEILRRMNLKVNGRKGLLTIQLVFLLRHRETDIIRFFMRLLIPPCFTENCYLLAAKKP